MKIAVFFGTGYEEIEALAVVDVLRRAKAEVVMVGVSGPTVVSSRKVSINMDTTIEAFDAEDVNMLVLPGGVPGVDHLYASEKLRELVKAFKKEGKWLGAICAAPSLLGRWGVLEGEKATCYPGYEKELKGCEVVSSRTVVSHKIITGIGAGASLEFALTIVEELMGKEKAQEIKMGMLIG
ncbi:DJ-1 family protein [Sporanaerobium hydrogeniformans]|uniref:DJ-1 family protein n=1 Tax=Sporanaerobium hydrogeniformans TaxID=3072179 RepID=A0AC61DC87_9FIRM|nr:DJ-1 family glyoxalase III [Sporanaerobium hydrogeniformans]PHV70358.1 DJ-1 family protein [Sporanaerobium hydrogeniformans]